MDERPEQPRPSAPLNRALLIAIAAVANGVGLLPYLLFIDRLHYLIVSVPAAAVLALFALRKLQPTAAPRPSAAEWLLGGWSALAMPSAGGLVGLLWYGIAYGLHRLYVGAATEWGFATLGDSSAWGYWGSIWYACAAAAIGATLNVSQLAGQLYPREAWARSPFFTLVTRLRWMAPAVAIVAVVFAMAPLFGLVDPHGVWFAVALSGFLFYTSFPLAELGEAADRAHDSAVDSLDKLLKQAGYNIVRAPRTGKVEIDPLLQGVDLLAKGKDRAFAIDVTSAGSSAPVEWNAAVAVQTAATLLSDEIDPGSGAPVPVEPVLMVVGGSVAQSLQAFSQRERVPVVHVAAHAAGNDPDLTRQLEAAGLVLAFARAASA